MFNYIIFCMYWEGIFPLSSGICYLSTRKVTVIYTYQIAAILFCVFIRRYIYSLHVCDVIWCHPSSKTRASPTWDAHCRPCWHKCKTPYDVTENDVIMMSFNIDPNQSIIWLYVSHGCIYIYIYIYIAVYTNSCVLCVAYVCVCLYVCVWH